MKSSLANNLYRIAYDASKETTHRKGIARRILTEGVYPLAKCEGRTRVIIPCPIPPMLPILNSMGYTEHNETGETPERMFMTHIVGTSNYFTLEI